MDGRFGLTDMPYKLTNRDNDKKTVGKAYSPFSLLIANWVVSSEFLGKARMLVLTNGEVLELSKTTPLRITFCAKEFVMPRKRTLVDKKYLITQKL